MHKILMFNNMSLDGFFADSDGGVGWAKRDNEELTEYVKRSRGDISTYLFGKHTYEMFAGFWPTPAGKAANPYFAKILGEGRKIVFSSTLKQATWENTVIEPKADTRSMDRIKATSGGDCLIFGSGTLVRDLAQKGLIDEYQFVINPVILGNGRALFCPLPRSIELQLVEAKPFQNGTVLMRYQPFKLAGT
jgi:dihydrofolate reductase